MKVIFSTPDWTISGVNTFHHNLARTLQASGHDVELMMARMQKPETAELPLPTDVPVTVLEFDKRSWFSRWFTVIGYLNARAPCIYIPGYDFDNSCVVSAVADQVGVVGVVHSDDPFHYEHLIRMGRFWNAAVAVSAYLHGRIVAEEPLVAPRSYQINCGVPCAPALPARPGGRRPLRIVYSGRFWEDQKRISDLPKIARALEIRGVPAEWTMIGSGQDEPMLRAGFAALADPGKVAFTGPIPSDEVLARYGDHDAFVLTSNFEGLPVSLMEAMGQGVIPLATEIESGIPEIVADGKNGFIRPVGDIDGFADRLALLHDDPERRMALHQAAHRTIRGSRFSIESVAARYLEVFDRIFRDLGDGSYRRPKPCRPGSRTGDIIPPPHLQYAPDEQRLTPDNVLRVASRRARAAVDRWRARVAGAAGGMLRSGPATPAAKGTRE